MHEVDQEVVFMYTLIKIWLVSFQSIKVNEGCEGI